MLNTQAVEKLAKSFKARMTVRLAVAGAFHTAYMQPAEEKLRCLQLKGSCIIKCHGMCSERCKSVVCLREALASTEIVVPRIPVVSNVDAQPHSDPDVIKDILARQVSLYCHVHANSIFSSTFYA